MEPNPPPGPPTPSSAALTDTQRWILVAVGTALVILIAVAAVLAIGADHDDTAPTTTTTSTSTTSSTTTASTTTIAAAVDAYAVAFPSPTSDDAFVDPAAVARAYATDILGFTDLAVGSFAAGDARSGEVEISDGRGGPVTVVTVRQMDDDAWYALGSTTENVTVTAPASGAALSSPFETRGRALAFEGTVDIVVREQADGSQMGSGFVTGSGTPPAGPFEGQIFFGTPSSATPGVLVYRTLSAEDGHVEAATSFPVRLTTEATPTAAVDCGSPEGAEDVDEESKVVKVFFHCDGELLAVRRTVPADDPAVLTASLRHLVAGPSDAEVTVGYTSVFSGLDATVTRVVIAEGAAVIDLAGVAGEGAPGEAAVSDLIAEVVATATQYTTVTAVDIHLDGSCDTFATWAGTDGCRVHG